MDSFYAVANGFLRRRAASKAIDKRRMKADPTQPLKLIQQVDSELVEIRQSVQKVRSKALQQGRTRTEAVAGAIVKRVALWRKDLKDTFAETIHDMRLHQEHRDMFLPNKEVDNFMIALRNVISFHFPEMGEKDRWALIGAAMAGAKLYRSKDFLKSDPDYLLSRVPVKIKRAESYAKEQYAENGYRSVFEALEGITKKPKPAARQQKQQGLARKRQKL